ETLVSPPPPPPSTPPRWGVARRDLRAGRRRRTTAPCQHPHRYCSADTAVRLSLQTSCHAGRGAPGTVGSPRPRPTALSVRPPAALPGTDPRARRRDARLEAPAGGGSQLGRATRSPGRSKLSARTLRRIARSAALALVLVLGALGSPFAG